MAVLLVCGHVAVVFCMQRLPLHVELVVASGTLAAIITIGCRPSLERERVARRRVRGECEDCGYDLFANESGVCPECGRQTR